MKVRLKSNKMAFVRCHYFALLTCSIFLYFISNQLFYRNDDSTNILPLVRKNESLKYYRNESNESSVNKVIIDSHRPVHLKMNYSNLNNVKFLNIKDINSTSIPKKITNLFFIAKKSSKINKGAKISSNEKTNVSVSVSHSIVTSVVNSRHPHHFQYHKNSTKRQSVKSVIVSSTPSSSTTTPLSLSSKRTSSSVKVEKKQSALNDAHMTDVSNEYKPIPMSTVSATSGTDWFQIFKDTAHKVYSQLFSPTENLPEFRKWALEKERSLLADEMKDYKFSPIKKKMGDLIMEKGGQPIRNLIFTTWRSGSTFLGEVLDSHPGTFYHYEPLLHFGLVQVRDGQLATEAIRVVRNLLNCNYNNLTDYMKNGEKEHWLYSHNSRLWNFCEKTHEVCWDAKWLGEMCKMFPFQALKTVRMRLKLARTLLQDPKLNIRLLHLVRDPRGTIQSRFHRDWCPTHPDCEDPAVLCSDLVQDYYEAKKMRVEFPDRFMVIRYEDISLNVEKAILKIFKFFRLQFHPKVKSFLDAHTTLNYGGVSSTYRDSRTAPFHWMADLASNFTTIANIQKSCKKALHVWGYNYVHNEKQLIGFNPVNKPPWKDMLPE